MFERISNSFALAQSSWQVLRQDKKLVVFPILSGIGCFLVMLGFALPFLVKPQWLQFLNEVGDGNKPPPWVYVVAFAYYFCNYFVVIFCNAALISCALIRFNGGEPSVGDGINAAVSRMPQILAWALVSATVGMLLKMVENAHEKAGAIISSLLGLAWSVLTYFVVPVLVVERVGPIDAVKRSTAILRKTWGEALVGGMGIGLFVFLLALPGIALLLIGAFACTKSVALGLGLLALGLIWLVAMSVISSALQGIFTAALYQYAANDQVPDGFDPYVIERAFHSK